MKDNNWLILILVIIGFAILLAYNGAKSDQSTTNQASQVQMESNATTFEDESGRSVQVEFSPEGETAMVIVFDGSTQLLTRQPSGSGFIYTNEDYELRGQENEVTLYQDGEVVFTGTEVVQESESVTLCNPEDKEMVACTREYNPVCGDDSMTYSNPCVACSSGNINSHSPGECE